MAATPPTSRSCRPATRRIRNRSIRNGATSSRAWTTIAGDVSKNAEGASWKARNWPIQANGELVSALDGNWGAGREACRATSSRKRRANGAALSDADVLQATRDSVRAIMMIRAFRMRGHLHANLDPLGLAKPLEDYNELSPEAYGFTDRRLRPSDLHRQGAGARIRDDPADAGDPDAHLLLDARRRVHAHFRSGREGLDPGAHRGPGQGHRLHRRRASGRSCRSWSRPKASSSSSTSSTRAPSASASTARNR